MIAALAGRRIDAVNAKSSRFSISRLPVVQNHIMREFKGRSIRYLVCSAACGADLAAISVAIALGLRFRIVLPVSIAEFRRTSVVDRPGDWGALYDRAIITARNRNDLVVLDTKPDSDGYQAANATIITQASKLAAERNELVAAFAVWDGVRRSDADATADFIDRAVVAQFSVSEIWTR